MADVLEQFIRSRQNPLSVRAGKHRGFAAAEQLTIMRALANVYPRAA